GCDSRADAALAPDGRSLCVVQREENEPTNTLQPLRPPLQVRQLPAQLGTAFSSPSIAPPSPDSGWTKVIHTSYKCYLPIYGRGLYAQESNGEYMLWNDVVYEYKLAPSDEETSRLIKLHPPARIDSVCPFIVMKGDGFLAHLGSGIMCSVWISLDLTCRCDYLHAIVTTFHIGPLPSDVKILHSTFRRVDMLPMKHIHEFQLCFLQEYMDDKVPAPQLHEEQVLLDDPCRHYLPPSPPRYMKPRIDIDKDLLFIICQGGSQSFIYKTNLDEIPSLQTGAPPLKPHYIVHGDDHGHRHFFRSSSKLCAVSFLKDGMDVIILDTECHTMDILARRPIQRFLDIRHIFYLLLIIWLHASIDARAARFLLFKKKKIQVGGATFALTKTLQVYRKARRVSVSPPGSTSWVRCHTDKSNVLDRKIKLLGYVALGDYSFIVSDSITCSCLRFDVPAKKWHVVMPWTLWGEYLPMAMPRNHLLNGACAFIDGFIYTCSNRGLAVYELLSENHCVYLKGPIFLPFSWLRKQWESEKMCLGYAGKEADSGAILFWVVQAVLVRFRPPKNQLWITAVRVETEKTPSKSMKPVETKHLLCATSIIDQVEGIDQEEVIRTT
ncbi:hypothetical protein ZWY2020_042034, partial [Hordeum vulgare]